MTTHRIHWKPRFFNQNPSRLHTKWKEEKPSNPSQNPTYPQRIIHQMLRETTKSNKPIRLILERYNKNQRIRRRNWKLGSDTHPQHSILLSQASWVTLLWGACGDLLEAGGIPTIEVRGVENRVCGRRRRQRLE